MPTGARDRLAFAGVDRVVATSRALWDLAWAGRRRAMDPSLVRGGQMPDRKRCEGKGFCEQIWACACVCVCVRACVLCCMRRVREKVIAKAYRSENSALAFARERIVLFGAGGRPRRVRPDRNG